MPVIYEGKTDGSNGVRYVHISLVRFYLDQAHEHAVKARLDHQAGVVLPASIVGILFSAMSIEAFVNEICEDIIPSGEINHFVHLRKKYKKANGESSVGAKVRMLFESKFNQAVPDDIAAEIEETVSLRNNLSHYKLSELAGKLIMPAVVETPCPNGGLSMYTVDFMAKPERVEPPFVQRVTGHAAVRCFNSALRLINYWGELHGESDSVPGLSVIA
jgi:hypothetical protein